MEEQLQAASKQPGRSSSYTYIFQEPQRAPSSHLPFGCLPESSPSHKAQGGPFIFLSKSRQPCPKRWP